MLERIDTGPLCELIVGGEGDAGDEHMGFAGADGGGDVVEEAVVTVLFVHGLADVGDGSVAVWLDDNGWGAGAVDGLDCLVVSAGGLLLGEEDVSFAVLGPACRSPCVATGMVNGGGEDCGKKSRECQQENCWMHFGGEDGGKKKALWYHKSRRNGRVTGLREEGL